MSGFGAAGVNRTIAHREAAAAAAARVCYLSTEAGGRTQYGRFLNSYEKYAPSRKYIGQREATQHLHRVDAVSLLASPYSTSQG